MSVQASISLEELPVAGPAGVIAIHGPGRALGWGGGTKVGALALNRGADLKTSREATP